MPSDTWLTDGQADWTGGVDSGKTPTIASNATPNGLAPNQLAWAANATARGGGICCRPGWRKVTLNFTGSTESAFLSSSTAIFQGATMYEQANGFPYMALFLGGHLYRIRLDTDNSVDELVLPGGPNSATRTQTWFAQGEEFLFMQNGVDNCLVWDGATMFRMNPSAQQVPKGTVMEYYMGRLWVANGRQYVASDIVGGPTGTLAYGFRDAIWNFTEAGFLAGGGALSVPPAAGPITALKYTANLDTSLGQGQLFVFTPRQVYSLNVPVSRADWQATTQPLQKVVQVRYGATSQNGVCHVNGDLFYRSADGIRSLMVALRYFDTWGNVPISRNMARIINREDRGLMRYASAIEFENRIWETCLPTIASRGIVWNTIGMLDFDLVSSLASRLPPVWEGSWSGLKVLQLLEGDYGGLQRAFAVVLNADNGIDIWEFTNSERFEEGDGRIQWAIETPAFTWKNEFQAKELKGCRLFVDKTFGKVDYEVYYRPDQYACWVPWHAWKDCAVRNPCEDPYAPDCYVLQSYREQYHPYDLPEPADEVNGVMLTEARLGYQFQLLIRVTGWARIRGIVVFAEPKQEAPYRWIVG